jgi:hypothetical protein
MFNTFFVAINIHLFIYFYLNTPIKIHNYVEVGYLGESIEVTSIFPNTFN